MVRSRSPLLSQSASGSIAGALTYSNTARGTTIRKTPRRLAPQTLPQAGSAAWMRWLINIWSTTGPANHATWAELAADLNISPYHAYLKHNSLRWAHDHGPSAAYPATELSPICDGVGATLTAGPRLVHVEIWGYTSIPPTWTWAIYRVPFPYPAPARKHLRYIWYYIDYSLHHDDAGDTGTTYLYYARGVNTDGGISPYFAIGPGTPE